METKGNRVSKDSDETALLQSRKDQSGHERKGERDDKGLQRA